jgi:hypothetical protein
MKIPREAWWVAALVVLALVVIVLLQGGRGGVSSGPESREAAYGVPTTYSSGRAGLRALYLTLRELRYDVRRLRVPFTSSTLPRHGVLVAAEPFGTPAPITPREWDAAYRWVASGNTLLLVGEWPAVDAQRDAPAVEGMFESGRPTSARPIQPTYLARGVRRLAVRASAHMPEPGAKALPPKASKRRQGDRWFFERLAKGLPPDLKQALRQAAPLFRDRNGVVVASARIGAGTAVVLTSPWSLSNEGIGRADNILFALNALGPPGAAPVFFDEYHNGYGENALWTLVPLPVKLALAQALLAILVVMYGASRRFGAVVPLDRGRRQRSEFLGTMTALLRKGQATRLALRTARDAATRQLRVEFGLRPEAGASELVQAASRVRSDRSEKLGAALRQCDQALQSRATLSEARAIALVRQLDEAVRSARQA